MNCIMMKVRDVSFTISAEIQFFYLFLCHDIIPRTFQYHIFQQAIAELR